MKTRNGAALTALVLALATGCFGSDEFETFESARDFAESADCKGIQAATIPSDWKHFDEAVTCEVDGVKVRVYWSAKGTTGVECLDSDSERCSGVREPFGYPTP